MFLLSKKLLKEVTLYMDDKKKKFIAPEAEVLDFANDDIVTVRSTAPAPWGGGDGEWWMD